MTTLALGSAVFDSGLNALRAADRIYLCTVQPTTYALATATYALGVKNFGGPNIAFMNITSWQRDPLDDGRGVGSQGYDVGASLGFNDGVVIANGTATYWAAVDSTTSSLLATGTLATPVTLAIGQTWGVQQGFQIDESQLATTTNDPVVSSAGVFDSTGALIRTLWCAQNNDPRALTPSTAWDGLKDDGTVAATGSYTVKVISHQLVLAWDGVIGNSTPEHVWDTRYWNPSSTPTGCCFTTDRFFFEVADSTEKWNTVLKFAENDCQHVSDLGGGAVRLYCCTDDVNVWCSVFATGQGALTNIVLGTVCATGAELAYSSAIIGNTYNKLAVNGADWVAGVAVQKAGSYLFIARTPSSGNGYIQVHNKTTGALVTTYTGFVNPTWLVCNRATGDLWVYNNAVLTKCTVDSSGNITPTSTTISLANVLSLSISFDGATVLLIDGTSHQIKAFNTSDGSVKSAWASSGAFGDAGGYANGPTVSDSRFMFFANASMGGWGPQGWAAFAADNSFWVGDSGNCRILHFSSGNARALLDRISYLPSSYTGYINRADSTRVMWRWLEFAVNYSLPLSPINGSWVLKRNWGQMLIDGNVTSDPNHYQLFKNWTTLSNGRTYGHVLNIFELDPVTGPRDTGIAGSATGWWKDPSFNIYTYNFANNSAGAKAIYVNPLTGFDASNNPTWKYTLADTSGWDVYLSTTVPTADFPGLESDYQPCEGLAGGLIPTYNMNGDWDCFHVGGVDKATGAIKFKTGPTTNDVAAGKYIDEQFWFWPPLPYFCAGQGNGNPGGPLAYVPGDNYFFTHFRGEQWGAGQTNLWTMWHQSGLPLARFGCLEPIFAALGQQLVFLSGQAQNDPVMGGTEKSAFTSFKGYPGASGNCIGHGCVLVNGVYYLYSTDEWYHGGFHRFSVSGRSNIAIVDTPVSWNAASYVAPSADPYDMLAGLPFATQGLANNTAGWTRSPLTDSGTNRFDNTTQYCKVCTNMVSDNKRSPDIGMSMLIPVTNGQGFIARTIPRSKTTDWSLVSTVVWPAQSFAEWDGTKTPPGSKQTNGNFWRALWLDIIDINGKIILRGLNGGYYGGWNSCLYLNDFTPIVTAFTDPGNYRWANYSDGMRAFNVVANQAAHTMTVTFGDYIKRGVPLYDATADITKPASLRSMFAADSQSTANVNQAIVFAALRFVE